MTLQIYKYNLKFVSMKKLFVAIGLVCVAIPLSYLLILNPFEHEADFSLSDFYTRASIRRSPTLISQDIVIVKADSLSRLGIARLAQQVDSCGSAVTVLDIMMNYPSSDDSLVVEALSGCSNLVIPYDIYSDTYGPIYSFIPNTSKGYANLESAGPENVVRKFSLENGLFASLDGAALKLYKPNLSYPKNGLIRYEVYEFEEFSPAEIVEFGDELKGKIVLIGCVNDFTDCHPTPIGMGPGVLIHARILQTVLSENTPRKASTFLVFIVSILLSIALMWIHIAYSSNNGDLGNFMLRINQIVLLYFIYLIGTILWHKSNYYFDLSLAITLVASASIVYDLIYGVLALIKWGKNNRLDGKQVL